MTDRTFRGAVVRTMASNGIPWERLTVGPDVATLKPWLRAGTSVERAAVESVEFVEQRLPPFSWRTLVRFRLANGVLQSRKFTPWRPRKVRDAFRDFGWPVLTLSWNDDLAKRMKGRRERHGGKAEAS
jgi:hypothetical protein